MLLNTENKDTDSTFDADLEQQTPRTGSKGERVTIDEAFTIVGGFGKFQKFSCIMNTLTNMGAAFFLNSFAFLELQPRYKCQLEPGVWTLGTAERPLEEEYCSAEQDNVCEIDWSSPHSLNNFMTQFNFYCQPKWKIGMLGFSFLLGIILGCLTISRLGDVYGRKPIYLLGLLMHLAFSVCICFLTTQSYTILYGLLVFFGMSLTARLYVGYSFNLEMQPKET